MIVTFDLTHIESFRNTKDWIGSLYKFKEETLPVVLVGNKYDLAETNRLVETTDAQSYATSHKMEYFETSAKTNHNVEELMRHMFEITCAYKKANMPVVEEPLKQ